jgi:hypothetical protein
MYSNDELCLLSLCVICKSQFKVTNLLCIHAYVIKIHRFVKTIHVPLNTFFVKPFSYHNS